MTDRIDKKLVEAGLAQTRSQAAQLIKEGVVFYNGELVKKPSLKVEKDGLEVRKEVLYVGRGAHKIEGALKKFDVSVENKVVADVGASTGGFTDFVLQNGAQKVFAIDVGHGQLAESLRQNSRVINLEGTNIRNGLNLEEKVDLAVVDLSFISLKLTLNPIFDLAKEDGKIIALVKPQFEAGRERLGKKAVIKDQEVREEVLKELYDWCSENSLYIHSAMRSPITGSDGNVEYFFYFDKNLSSHLLNSELLIGL